MSTASSFWNQRSVLVTGATGLLGSWLVKRLRATESQVVCLVRDWVPDSELVRTGLIRQVRVVNGDLRDQGLIERTLNEYEVRTVFHLAAQTLVTVANQAPVATLEANVAGTWTVLEACRQTAGVQQVVLASSDKAYGDHENLPYEETTPLQGRHPYDVSKSCADLLGQAYAATYQLPVAITRCGNIFGGGDLNWSRLVPGTIQSVLRGERPIIRSDGKSIRDYMYVEDAAAAYVLLAERLAAQPELRGQAFNFANEQPVTVLEMVEHILRLMGSDLIAEVRDDAEHEIRHQYLNTSKARQMLGWKPAFTLDEGLQPTIDWYRVFCP